MPTTNHAINHATKTPLFGKNKEFFQFRGLTGFGLDYEQPIGRVSAKKLLPAGVELPRMGYEVVLRHIRERDSLNSRCGFTTGILTLQNVSGQLVLASSTHRWGLWPTVFELSLTPTAQQ